MNNTWQQKGSQASLKISSSHTFPISFGSVLVVHQFYQVRVIDEFVLRGNSATLKCLVPSFITEFVDVEAWLSSEEEEFTQQKPDRGWPSSSQFNKVLL